MDYALLFKMFLFSIFIAFLVAKLEIEIEGKNGWAENLPTWRIKNFWTSLLLGNYPLTGYHTWMVALIVSCLHFAFVLGISWTVGLELQMFAIYWIAVIVEDVLWFVMNPAFGIKKFNKIDAHWHGDWIGPIPGLYLRQGVLIIGAFFLSSFFL